MRRPFDLSTPAQATALASLDDPAEVARRRQLNEEGRGAVEQALRDAGLDVAGPAVANFVYADVGDDALPLFEALLRLGVIVRPLHGFGAPGAIRVSVGTPEETAIFAEALAHVRAAAWRDPRTGLLGRAPAFRLLFLATLGSGLGSMLAVIALTVDVYERTGSGAWVSAVLVADFLPTIAIGLLLGPLVDRLSRRWLMVGADLVRLGAFVALPFAPDAATIVGLALVVGFANGFFRPAAYAGMPNLVDRADLARANSLFQATDNLTWLLGPLLGGVLLGAYGPDVPYLVNAATFALSALLVLRIPARLLASEEPISRGHWRDLAEGFGVVFRSRALLTVLVAWTIVMAGNAAVNVAEVFLVRESFDAGNLGLGILMGGAGAGLVVGSLLAGPLLERWRVGHVYAASIATMAVGFGVAAVSSQRLARAAVRGRLRDRERRGERQPAARPDRGAGPAARPRLHGRDERQLRGARAGHGRRRPADGRGRRALAVGRRGGDLRDRLGRRVGARAMLRTGRGRARRADARRRGGGPGRAGGRGGAP